MAHVIVLPAAVAAVPATALIDRMSLDEYCVVHWSAAGWLPVEVSVSERVAAPPEAVADESVIALWANNTCDASRAAANSLNLCINELP